MLESAVRRRPAILWCQSLLWRRAREQISLIDGYKMLRMELEAQQANALEWNGVHSWVTSLFQWCSKRRINPPNSLWKKIQPQAGDGDSTTDSRLRHLRLTHIQYARKSNHKSAPGIVTTKNTHQTAKPLQTSFFSSLTFTFYPQWRYHWEQAKSSPEGCHAVSCQVNVSRRFSLLKRPRGARVKSWTDKEQADINTNTAKSSSLLLKEADLQGQMTVLMLSLSPCAERGQVKVKRTAAHQPHMSCIYKVKLFLSWETWAGMCFQLELTYFTYSMIIQVL